MTTITKNRWNGNRTSRRSIEVTMQKIKKTKLQVEEPRLVQRSARILPNFTTTEPNHGHFDNLGQIWSYSFILGGILCERTDKLHIFEQSIFFLSPYTYLKFRLFTPLHWKHLKFKPNCRQTITGGFCAIEGKHQTTL